MHECRKEVAASKGGISFKVEHIALVAKILRLRIDVHIDTKIVEIIGWKSKR